MSNDSYLLNRDTRQRLLSALTSIPVLGTRAGRDLLLIDLPMPLIASITRSDTAIVDFNSILNSASASGHLGGESGPLALQLVLENAYNLTPDSAPGRIIAEILGKLGKEGERVQPPTGSNISAKLSGTEYQYWQVALLSACPTYSVLRQMVYFGLDTDLENITEEGPLESVMFNLIRWAQAQGRLDDLLRAALNAAPRNEKLRQLAIQYGIEIDKVK